MYLINILLNNQTPQQELTTKKSLMYLIMKRPKIQRIKVDNFCYYGWDYLDVGFAFNTKEMVLRCSIEESKTTKTCGIFSDLEYAFQYSIDNAKEIFKTYSITKEEQLRKQLQHHIKHELNTTPNKIKEGKVKNPFPIGTRSVYVFASGGVISDSAKWKLLIFFESQQ